MGPIVAITLLASGGAPVKPALDAVLDDPRISGATVSATISDLDGHVVFERNPGARVVPASNQKLFSAAYALWATGPDYRPQTKIWRDWNRVVVDSPGDPLLSFETLSEAAKRLGLDRSLPVYVHEPYAPQFPGGWEIEDLPNKYAAPVAGFTVDRGSFAIWNVQGKPKLLPDSYGVRIIKGDHLQYDPFARRVIVPDPLPLTETKCLDTLALPRADECASMLLGRWFFRIDTIPSREANLVIIGHTMTDMLKACLPPSDNNIAEHLLLIGAAREKPLPNPDDPYPEARLRLTHFLERVVGIQEGDVLPYDGSGMSKEDVVTTRAVAKLLSWAAKQPTAEVWKSALAHAGQTGTLAKRLAGVAFWGKTGTLNRVSSLSGYLKTASGREVIVSLVINNFRCSDADAHAVEDAFVKAMNSDAP